MDKIRLILTLVTIAIVAIPIVGMLLAYQGNLLGLFIPPEITEIEDIMGGDGGLEPPQIVGEPEYNETTGTFSISFEYTNSFPIDITFNSLVGNIKCSEHHFTLGNASLSESVSIDVGETETLTVLGIWNEDAMGDTGHFKAEHGADETVDVVLADLAVDISGIQIQMDENEMGEMQVPNPTYQG